MNWRYPFLEPDTNGTDLYKRTVSHTMATSKTKGFVLQKHYTTYRETRFTSQICLHVGRWEVSSVVCGRLGTLEVRMFENEEDLFVLHEGAN